MALVCDYCGDVTEAAERIQVAFGHSQEIALKSATAQEWFHYCEGDCARAVHAMLDNLRLYAMHGEGSGLVWQLAEQDQAPVAGDVKPAGAEGGSPRQRQKKPHPVNVNDKKEKKGQEEVEARLGRQTLSYFLKWGDRHIDVPDYRERREQGTKVDAYVAHQGSRGTLYNANILTLEEAAAFTAVEFAGLPGIGVKIIDNIKRGFAENGLEFRAGPSLNQLGALLREKREAADFSHDDIVPIILDRIEAPLYRNPSREEEPAVESRAWMDLWDLLRSAEAGRKPLPPVVLDALAEQFGTTRELLLHDARRVAC